MEDRSQIDGTQSRTYVQHVFFHQTRTKITKGVITAQIKAKISLVPLTFGTVSVLAKIKLKNKT